MKTSRIARCRLPFRLLSILLTTTPLFTTSLFANSCNDAAGRLESAEGSVAVAGSSGSWQSLAIGDCIPVDSQVKVSNGRAVFRLANETLLRTAGETQLRFSSPQQKRWIHLIDGLLHLITRTPRDLEVESEYVNAAVKGTEFIVASDRASASGQVIVLEGEVVASNGQGQQAVTGGNAVVASSGAALQSITVPALRDAVQWTLHYPPLPLPSQPRFATINAAIKAGDLSAALRELDAIPANERDADYLTMHAAIDLQRGDVASARTQLQQALTLDQNNSTAFALQAATEIALGDNDQADALLARSRNDDTIALITRSYLQQARFDLPAAQATAEQAAGVNDSNAWIQARVAELALMNGDTRRADEAIQKALALNPNNGRAHALNGFLQLQRLDLDGAEKTFTQAAKLDSNDPMPRLGLGLIEIRHNNLTAGREQLELAVALDPGQSLLRSYLGKAYQLEQRDALAGDQYALAKTFDNADPTPWLYSALLAQSQNRPFEALQMIEESIKRNDNRAVYRSRQQLDGDEATRTASQAAIYRQLGFTELAQRTAAHAVAKLPSESASHRQLAESYADNPEFDAARSSEVLQAQLTQPISATPVQPLLAESQLLVRDGAGPGALGLYEYSELFVQERPYLLISGLGGSNDTGAGEASISGVYDRIAYTVNQYHYETSGYRENGDAKYDVISASAKYQVSTKFSTFLLVNQRQQNQGFINETLLTTEERPHQTQDRKSKSALLGFHFKPTTKADFITALNYSDVESSLFQRVALSQLPPITLETIENSESEVANAEIQAQLHTQLGEVIAGADWSKIESTVDSQEVFTIPEIFQLTTTFPATDQSIEHQTLYLYWSTPTFKSLSLTMGSALSELNDDIYDEKLSELLPKFSVNYSVNKNLEIRAVYFESLKRPLLTEQTLEPTQIGGFNQFFDENNGIKSSQIGIGFDYLAGNHHIGAEILDRNLEIPRVDTVFNISYLDAKQQQGMIYWGWKAKPWAISLSYIYNQSEYDGVVLQTHPSPLKTQRIPLELKWISGTGITLGTFATYFDQEGTFFQGNADRHETFTLLGAEARYTLPHNHIEISIRVDNLLDESFSYQNTSLYDASPQLTPYVPERTAQIGFKLNY